MLQGEVRLVRCPKCRNILPEFNSYSLYQCGVCGTILRAKSTKPHEQKQASEYSNGDTTIHAEDEEPPDNNNDRDISIHEKKDNISQSPGGVPPTGRFHNDASTMDDDHLDKLAEEDASRSSCFSDMGKEENTRSRGKIKLKEEESGELLSKMDELINHLSRFSFNTREEENEEQTAAAAALSSRPYAHSCNLATDGPHSQWREGRQSMLLHSAPLRPASFMKLKNGSNFSYDGAFRGGGYSRPVGIYSGRRRCRAVGGGAPFVVCSHCWELLQIESMKGGRVRCGSCMKPVVVVMDCGGERKKKKRVGFNESGLGIKEGKGKQWRKAEGNKGGYLRPPPGAPLQLHFDYSSNNLGGGGVEEREEGGGGLVGRIKRGIKDLHRLGGF